MDWVKKNWRRTPGQVRKPLIFLLGFTVVVTGIILLPLPGPGWLVIFAGFAILATEFEFAERIKNRVVGILKQAADWCLDQWHKITGKKTK